MAAIGGFTVGLLLAALRTLPLESYLSERGSKFSVACERQRDSPFAPELALIYVSGRV